LHLGHERGDHDAAIACAHQLTGAAAAERWAKGIEARGDPSAGIEAVGITEFLQDQLQ